MKAELVETQRHMQRLGIRGNFTKPENMHLTLAFIGEYPGPEDILDVINEIRFEPFAIGLDGMGSFGNLWWAGIRGQEALKPLAKSLRHGLAEAGIPFDRKKFTPHITLVRRPISPDGRIPAAVLQHALKSEMIVDRISLMRSDRGKNGMIYTEIE
ncbi:MAG: RNA 2',3'-cyclic phosphodiesterase [Bacillota bacterium]|nr:RNA 2',3'-cyclic phosphodiesterase [Bacillota bacterium]